MMSENIASGMSELVRLGIVHRDLAARNVMVDKWLQVRANIFSNFWIRRIIPLSKFWNMFVWYSVLFYYKAKVGDFGLAREGAEYKMELEDELGDRKKVVK